MRLPSSKGLNDGRTLPVPTLGQPVHNPSTATPGMAAC